MDEVGGALIAIALVLCAVFVPSAFITGISGQFYRQFALTIAGATVISLIVSLTLSPALCALLLKPHGAAAARALVGAADPRLLRRLQSRLRRGSARGYGWLAARVVRFAVIMLLVYAGDPRLRPQRIPQDAGRLHPAARSRLPDRRGAIAAGRLARAHRRGATGASSTSRSKMPGVAGAVNIVGFSGATFTNAPNAGAVFLVLDPFEKRAKRSRASRPPRIQRELFEQARRDPGGAGARRAAAAGARASAMPAASA